MSHKTNSKEIKSSLKDITVIVYKIKGFEGR